MTLFLLACVLLLALSTIFYLRPSHRSGGDEQDLERANLEWFQRRLEELKAEGNDGLTDDAKLRLLEDDQQSKPKSGLAGSSATFPSWLLLPLLALFSAALYFQLGAAPDVLISRQLQALDQDSTAAQMDDLMLAIEKRATQRPENLHYIAILGRFYMGQQKYTQAAGVYAELVVAAPDDAQALAFAAQAQYLAAGRKLDDSARLQAEQALAMDPQQRTALGLLGMASFEQGMYRAAIDYWQRLVASEPAGSETARMITGVIASAREQLAGGAESGAAQGGSRLAGNSAADADAEVSVSVTVSLPEGATISPSDVLFVLARGAQSNSRMPVAVQRLQGISLPITVRLDDNNSMAGQKLSQSGALVIVAQVSPTGQPGEANASWVAQSDPIDAATDGAQTALRLRPGPALRVP